MKRLMILICLLVVFFMACENEQIEENILNEVTNEETVVIVDDTIEDLQIKWQFNVYKEKGITYTECAIRINHKLYDVGSFLGLPELIDVEGAITAFKSQDGEEDVVGALYSKDDETMILTFEKSGPNIETVNNSDEILVGKYLEYTVGDPNYNNRDHLFRVQTTPDILNIRAGHSTDYEIIGKANKGSVYQVLNIFRDDDDDIWYEIRLDEGTGYIASWFSQHTEREPFIYQSGECIELTVDDVYVENQLVHVTDFLDNSSYEVYIDGELIKSEINLKGIGKHVVYAVNKNNRDIQTIDYTFEVVDHTLMTVKYDTYKSDRKSLGTISYDELKSMDKSLYITYDNGILYWYQLTEGDVECYVAINNSGISTNNAKIIANDKIFDLEDYYLQRKILLNKYFVVKDDEWIKKIINIQTGDAIEIYRGHLGYYDDYVFLVDISETVDGGNEIPESKLFDFKLYDLNQDRIERVKSIGKLCYVDLYFGRPLDLNKYLHLTCVSDDPWAYSDLELVQEIYTLVQKDGRFEFELIESPIIDVPDELVQVYDQIGIHNNVIGTYHVSDFKSIESSFVVDIVKNKYAYWYDVTLQDGRKGYVYRHLRSNEEGLIFSAYDFDLLFEDGTYYHVNSSYSHLYVVLRLDDLFIRYNEYMLSYVYEGISTTIVNKHSKEISRLVDWYVIESESNEYVLFEQFPHGYAGSGLVLHKVANGIREKAFEIIVPSGEPYSWIEDMALSKDNVVTFDFHYGDGDIVYPVKIHLVDEEWIVESDYDIQLIMPE